MKENVHRGWFKRKVTSLGPTRAFLAGIGLGCFSVSVLGLLFLASFELRYFFQSSALDVVFSAVVDVQDAYQGVLARSADKGGLLIYVKHVVLDRKTIEWVHSTLAKSEEAKEHLARVESNELKILNGRLAFAKAAADVQRAYTEFLGRNVDEEGLVNYVQQIVDENRDIEWVRNILASSAEGQTHVVALRGNPSAQEITSKGQDFVDQVLEAGSEGGEDREAEGNQSMTCACGDWFDRDANLCYMSEPRIVLYFGGYQRERGTFVTYMARWLQPVVSPTEEYQAAWCAGNASGLKSYAWYTYSPGQAHIAHEIYTTCWGLPENLVRCLLTTEKSRTVQLHRTKSPLRLPSVIEQLRYLSVPACANEERCVDYRVIAETSKKTHTCDFERGRSLTHHAQSTSSTTIVAFLGFQVATTSSSSDNGTGQISHDDLWESSHYVRSFTEAFVHIRAMWRCGVPFAFARYGDGELGIMNGEVYLAGADLIQWRYDPSKNSAVHKQVIALLLKGFKLASSGSKVASGMYLGLPFYICAEGLQRDSDTGGAGDHENLLRYYHLFGDDLSSVQSDRIMYSWQWGFSNYFKTLELLEEMGESGNVILICSEVVLNHTENLPWWATQVYTVSPRAMEMLMSGEVNLNEVTMQAEALAKSQKGKTFLFSCGPYSNILISIMWSASQSNTYIDIGSVLDYKIFGVKTRDGTAFDRSGPQDRWQPWVSKLRLPTNYSCHETRWELKKHHGVVAPRIIPVGLSFHADDCTQSQSHPFFNYEG